MRKIVNINCFDTSRPDEPLFTITIRTVEYVDLIAFIERGLTDFGKSKWLAGIQNAVISIRSGYFIDGEFVVKYEIID